MKVQFMKFLMLTIGIFGAGVIAAQQVIKFEGGQFEVVFKANTAGYASMTNLKSSGNLGLDYTGVEKRQFQVQIQSPKWNAGYEDNELVVLSANQPKGMSKKTSTILPMSKSNHKRRISYEVVDDATGQLKISFGYRKKGADPSTTTPIAGKDVVKSVQITGIKAKVEAPPQPTWCSGWNGSYYCFTDGKVRVRLLTNANGVKIFDKNNNPLIDFKGVAKPLIQVEVSSIEWRQETKKFVVKNGWVKGTSSALQKKGGGNIELVGAGTKNINFTPIGNGAASITFQYGVGESSAAAGSIASMGSITKSFRIAGIGADGPDEEEDDKEKLKKEEAAYQKAVESNTFKAYQDYLDNPKFAQDARFNAHQRAIADKIKGTAISYKTISKNEDAEGNFIFEIELSDVKDPSAMSSDENVEATVTGNALKVIIKDGDVHKVSVTDAYERSIEIELNPDSKVLDGDFTDGEETITYSIKGGEPPYFVTIIDATTESFVGNIAKLAPAEGKSSVKGEFIKQDLDDKFELEGNYKIQLKDSRKTETIVSENEMVFAASGAQGVIFILLGVMVVLLIVIGIVIKKNL